MGIETSVIRHICTHRLWKINRPGRRRRLESVRHAQACGHRALNLPPIRVAAFDGAPSHFRHSESQPDGRPAPVRSGQAPQGVGIKTSAFRQFALSGARPREPLPFVSSIREVPVRTGWCRRRAVNAVPLGQEVRFHPLPTNFVDTRIWSIGWAPERHSGDGGSIPSIRTSSRRRFFPHRFAGICRITSLRKLIW